LGAVGWGGEGKPLTRDWQAFLDLGEGGCVGFGPEVELDGAGRGRLLATVDPGVREDLEREKIFIVPNPWDGKQEMVFCW
jgi:hypothetical protein